jgi:glycolate oxidase FAD binding subunit
VDQQHSIVETVKDAIAAGTSLAIHGGRTKTFYGYREQGEPLDVSGHRGIVEYDPGELVITCRASTLLSEIRAALKVNGQYLPFEPPAFGDKATIGGTVACGFSGPRRPWSGSLRDYLLGVKLVNGRGAVVRYGGQVMKNVAGYDISRLVAGSMGTLGVLLEASFKVLPMPAREMTLGFNCDQHEAIRRVNEWSAQPLPLSGASWCQGQLLVRLSGAWTETGRAAKRLQADQESEDSRHWTELREHQSGFFMEAGNLWRLSLPPAAEPLDVQGDCLVDWGGAQRWCRTEMPADDIRAQATARSGHATLFRGSADVERCHPLAPAVRQVHQRIKQAFDPSAVFNPYRMSRDW